MREHWKEQQAYYIPIVDFGLQDSLAIILALCYDMVCSLNLQILYTCACPHLIGQR